MINLRRMGLPKKASPFKYKHKSLISISALQQKMMDFYKENNRCVIHTPRRAGKDIFLIMQAMLTDKPIYMVCPNRGMVSCMRKDFMRFCYDNRIRNITSTSKSINVGEKKITFITMDELDYRGSLSNNNAYFFNEYTMYDAIHLPLAELDDVILIGTPGGKNTFIDGDVTGMFAGLIINDGD